MGKKCTVCGAPMSGRKCDYCGKHTSEEKEDFQSASPDHSGSFVLSRSKNFALIGIYAVGMVLLPILAMLIIILIRDYTLRYISEDDLFSMGTLGTVITYAILCGVMLLLTYKVFKHDLKKIDSWGKFFIQMGLGILCTFTAALVGNTIVMLLGTEEMALNQELVESALAAMPLVMIITIVLLAPVVEEIIFRLVLMNLFNWKPIYNLIFSSFIFGLMHVVVGGLIHIIPYFLMGLVFGYFYLKNNNIWHVTILHMLHNGLTVVLVFWAQHMQYVFDLY